MNTFATFYAKYPRHLCKRDAEKAWNQAIKRGATPDAIMSTLELRLSGEWRKRSKDHIPYPATFLRSEDFDDEFEAREDDKEAMPLFTKLETDTHLADRAELIHRSLTREQEVWRREAAGHSHSERCGCGERCKYRKEPRVPTIEELVAHLKGGR